VGIVGLGGLGHVAIKFAAAFGAEVVVLTTSPSKRDDALRLGADHVVVSADSAQMKQYRGSLDFILDTVSAPHDVNAELGLLARDGTLCLVGMPTEPVLVAAAALVGGRRRVAGSAIGGIAETQELLDFCAEHRIAPDVEIIDVTQLQMAFERMVRGQVRYRSVIDIATLQSS
jgi:alcohol dehydrogenase (NADP+)